MEIKNNFYAKSKEYAQYISSTCSELEAITDMINNELVDESKMNPKFEYRQRQDIKNALSNIYLMLDLHEVEGVADQIFNSEFVKK